MTQHPAPTPARWYVNALLALAAIIVALCAVEIGLRIAAPVDDPFEGSKSRQYVNQYIRSAFAPGMRLETEAEKGLPGLAGEHLFTTNNAGFRGDSLLDPKPAEEYRAFVIGGSTIEGLYLDDSQTVTAVLQRTLSSGATRVVKVYNAGKSGDKSDDHISMLAHRLVHLEPDLIVVMQGLNDLRASIAGLDYRHFDARPAFTAAAPPPLGLSSLISLAATEFQLPRRLYYAVKRLRPRRALDVQERITLRSSVRDAAEEMRQLPVSSHRPVADTASFRRNVRTLAGIAAGHGVPLVLVTHPSTWDAADSVIADWQWMRAVGDTAYTARDMAAALEELNDVTRTAAARLHVPVFDLARIASKSTRHFYDDAHFNPAGARAAGDGLGRFLLGLSLPGLR